MKITLVRPYFRHNPYEPPLGVAILSAYLRRAGHNVNIIDFEALGIKSEKSIRDMLKKDSPDIVGVSFFTYDRFKAIHVARIAKEIGAIVIGGGIHITFDPVNTLDKVSAFDYGIMGEGEETFVELLDCLTSGKDLEDVKGIVYRKNGQIIKNPLRALITDIDSIPMPDYHLLPMDLYPYHQILGSRGCPYNCIFCASPEFWRRQVRYRSPKLIVDEIEHLVKTYGNKEFDFKDDILFLKKEWTTDICREILERDIRIEWNCMGRVDVIDSDLFKLMKEAGCKTLRFGIESGSERILKKIGKNITKEQVRIAVDTAKKVPFETGTMFMLGHPTETIEEMEQTLDFAIKLGAEHYSFKPADIYPGTKLFEIAKEEGILSSEFNWFKKGLFNKGFHTYKDIPSFESNIFSRSLLENTAKRFYVRSFFERIFSFSQIKDLEVSRFKTGIGFVPVKIGDIRIMGQEILKELKRKRPFKNMVAGVLIGTSLLSKKIFKKVYNKNRGEAMKQVFMKKGKVLVEEVPVPAVSGGEMLVQVYYSCISSGTELSGIKKSGQTLLKRAMEEPENIKKTIEMLKTQGLIKTISEVNKQTSGETQLGYSAAGIVLETGNKINDIKPGDYVACCGAGVANHAEFITVPRNLAVKIPEGVGLDLAATASLGSIAIQAVRRVDPKLGENAVVVGLGVLGQIIVQLLKASGCKVIGMDPIGKRVEKALSLGLDHGINPKDDDPVEAISDLTKGLGTDSVIITAASKDNTIIDQAMDMARKKGRVVIVGDVGLDIDRKKFYKKELDLLISTSYGPGRYDEKYEIKGIDYPYEYVRWTENRNMQAYLDLIKDKKIQIEHLIDKVFSIENAEEAFDMPRKGEDRIITLLEYQKDTQRSSKIMISDVKAVPKDIINIGMIGAGNFADSVLLPSLNKLKAYYGIYAVMSKKGISAKSLAKKSNAKYATTDLDEMIKDKNIDMVIISTRHNLHAELAVKAAKGGKAIFLEKPMALGRDELKMITNVLTETKVPFMVGYNRRFSPFAKETKSIIINRRSPLIVNYRMNAGFIPINSWVHTEEGGGRNIGEACHIYDLFNFFTEEEVESVSVSCINPGDSRYLKNDNFIATVKYKDGSVCTLTYTAMGSKSHPKEEMELYVDGKIIKMVDYKKLEVFGSRRKKMGSIVAEKGHTEELKVFKDSINISDGYPIPLWQLVQASEISFKIEELLKNQTI